MTQAVQVAQYGSNNVGLSFKNRIINGDMRIDQRNAGASVTPGNTYTLDRWTANQNVSSKFTVQQNAGSVTPPPGFTNYLGVTSTSSYSVATGDYIGLGQSIEGYNVADLDWGKTSAKTITVSFWVRSSLTGLFSCAVTNYAYSRGYTTSYTISSANTWEQKTITIPGDITGTWVTGNDAGLRFWFNLGSGSSQIATPNTWGNWAGWSVTGATSIVGTNGATFYITGVQLEKGSVATSFDYRPYGTELALCQRYYNQYGNPYTGTSNKTGSGVVVSSTEMQISFFSQTMRSTPTATYSAGVQLFDPGAAPTITSVTTLGIMGNNITGQFAASGGGLTTGRSGMIRLNASTDYIAFSSEL